MTRHHRANNGDATDADWEATARRLAWEEAAAKLLLTMCGVATVVVACTLWCGHCGA